MMSNSLCCDVMRTTLTLTDDVAALLDRARKRQGGSLKTVVNEALRRGLPDLIGDHPSEPRRFRTRAVDLQPLVAEVDNVAEALALGEGEAFS